MRVVVGGGARPRWAEVPSPPARQCTTVGRRAFTKALGVRRRDQTTVGRGVLASREAVYHGGPTCLHVRSWRRRSSRFEVEAAKKGAEARDRGRRRQGETRSVRTRGEREKPKPIRRAGAGSAAKPERRRGRVGRVGQVRIKASKNPARGRRALSQEVPAPARPSQEGEERSHGMCWPLFAPQGRRCRAHDKEAP